MAISVGSSSNDEELNASINTTPLVDVMLVLLIIFLITIPVVTHTVPVKLPAERNQPTQTKPENVLISVNRDGEIYWGQQLIPDNQTLVNRVKAISVITPQPEVHIRGDQEARYQDIGRVLTAAERAGIQKVGFITEPPPNGAN